MESRCALVRVPGERARPRTHGNAQVFALESIFTEGAALLLQESSREEGGIGAQRLAFSVYS